MANATPTGSGTEQAAKGQAQQSKREQQQAAKGQRAQQAQGTAREPSSQRSAGGLAQRGSGAPAYLGPRLWGASPFALMRRMMEDMERLFDEYVPGRFAPPTAGEVQPRGLPFMAAWEPQVDVVRRGGQIVVRADLPGLSKDDVHVEIADEGLVLEGERRSELEEEREGMYRAERSYGAFRRVIPLPEGVDSAGAEAHFDHGVLEVTLSTPEAKPRGKRIDIQEGKSSKPSHMH